MRIVAWSTPARQDLEEIFNFYLKRNPSTAARIHNSIITESDKLGEWPDIGQYIKLTNNQNDKYQFRSLVTSDGLYKIIYFVTDRKVVISRIWSCRRNPKKIKL